MTPIIPIGMALGWGRDDPGWIGMNIGGAEGAGEIAGIAREIADIAGIGMHKGPCRVNAVDPSWQEIDSGDVTS